MFVNLSETMQQSFNHRLDEITAPDASLLAKVQHGEALDLGDLEQLAQKAVPDPVTIDYVRLTRAAYTLSPQDMWLVVSPATPAEYRPSLCGTRGA